MSFSRLVSRWRGLALSLIAVIATVWLGVSGQLGLYIHPRYYVFTMIMAGVAVVLLVGAFAVVPRADDEQEHGPEHEHEHEHDGAHGGEHHGHPEPISRRGRVWALTGAAVTVLIVVGAVAALLVVPPATLTSATVEQRSLNGSSNTLANAGTASATGDTASYTVKDWSTLIRQGTGADALAGTTATLVGFVTPDADDPDNVFYIARFVVTCCAVDAQPVGVAVYQPGWFSSYATDSWVSATGTFAANPSVLSTATTVLQPSSIDAIAQPAEPYVY